MLRAIFDWIFGRSATAPGRAPVPPSIDSLNRQAPLRAPSARSKVETKTVGTAGTSPTAADEIGATFLSREAVLNRKEKIAGYQFMLQESTRNRIRNSSRKVHQLYAEVLVTSLARTEIGKLLGQRMAFIDVPDSFLDHPSLGQLSTSNTVLVLTALADPGAPDADTLLRNVRRLRAIGFRIGLPDPLSEPRFAALMPEADVIVARAPQLDAQIALLLSAQIVEQAPQATLLVRDLPGLEDFRFCFQLGGALFQGPFISSRENWQDRNLSANVARLAMLVGKLRKSVETEEIVALLKQDAAVAVRLLRYINSAANGLSEQVSSIERALALLGRDKLYRWLVLLMCSTDEGGGRSSAVLETALVRARMMELLGKERNAAEREALFLTGLLSLIDIVLQVPMERAIASLAVSPAIEAAVLRGEGPHAAHLALAQACERMDADAVRNAAERCNVQPEVAAEAHLEALAWALSIQQE